MLYWQPRTVPSLAQTLLGKSSNPYARVSAARTRQLFEYTFSESVRRLAMHQSITGTLNHGRYDFDKRNSIFRTSVPKIFPGLFLGYFPLPIHFSFLTSPVRLAPQ
jgi:hypothetical protein